MIAYRVVWRGVGGGVWMEWGGDLVCRVWHGISLSQTWHEILCNLVVNN